MRCRRKRTRACGRDPKGPAPAAWRSRSPVNLGRRAVSRLGQSLMGTCPVQRTRRRFALIDQHFGNLSVRERASNCASVVGASQSERAISKHIIVMRAMRGCSRVDVAVHGRDCEFLGSAVACLLAISAACEQHVKDYPEDSERLVESSRVCYEGRTRAKLQSLTQSVSQR